MFVEPVLILPDGAPCSEAQSQPGFPPGLADAYAELYRARGYHPPWIGYLARCGDETVGSCDGVVWEWPLERETGRP